MLWECVLASGGRGRPGSLSSPPLLLLLSAPKRAGRLLVAVAAVPVVALAAALPAPVVVAVHTSGWRERESEQTIQREGPKRRMLCIGKGYTATKGQAVQARSAGAVSLERGGLNESETLSMRVLLHPQPSTLHPKLKR